MRVFWLTVLLMCGSPAWSQTVVASVEPLAKLLRSLFGDQVTVETLLQANQNPHQLALSPRQAQLIQQADLLVWLGEEVEAPLAPLVSQRRKPSLALLELEGVVRRGLEEEHDHEHALEATDGAHPQEVDDHGAFVDPHLWLSTANMTLLAATLAEQYPRHLQDGQPALFQDALLAHQLRWLARLQDLQTVPWLSYHHPWGYFTEDLGLVEPLVVSQQLDAGPGSRRFVELAGALREQQVRCAIREPEARVGMLKRLCPDCFVQPLDPLGRDAPELDYLPWLDSLVEGFAQCLQAASQS